MFLYVFGKSIVPPEAFRLPNVNLLKRSISAARSSSVAQLSLWALNRKDAPFLMPSVIPWRCIAIRSRVGFMAWLFSPKRSFLYWYRVRMPRRSSSTAARFILPRVNRMYGRPW